MDNRTRDFIVASLNQVAATSDFPFRVQINTIPQVSTVYAANEAGCFPAIE
jgi:hypothetical protein